MIFSEGLNKNFKIYKKPPGFVPSLKSLFFRKYQEKQAVNSFDLHIPKGKIVGLLGPNGAGKTTLMKMFTGIIIPSSGSLKVLGYTPSKRERAFRKKIALVMGHKSQLWWDLPAMDSFNLLKRYYEISEKDFKQRVNELSELLNVKHILNVHVRRLSLGERMKVELMSSLLHSPEVIFLDEPTIGLDLIAQNNIRNFLKQYHKKTGTTILITSHYMADIDALCSELILIINGVKRFDGSINQFENLLGSEKIVNFTFSKPIELENGVWHQFKANWNHDKTQVELSIPEKQMREVSQKILSEYPVCDFNTDKMPIERVMKALLENPELTGPY